MTQQAKAIPIVIVRNGHEQSAHHLNRGDQIAMREYDVERGCYVFHLLTEVPPSAEVLAAEEWKCPERGHRFEFGKQCCMECGEAWTP